jgi:hypothetical protein
MTKKKTKLQLALRLPATKPSRSGEACYVDKDGNVSNQALHDEIMEGVDDQVCIRHARAIIGDSLPKELLDCLYPLKEGSK